MSDSPPSWSQMWRVFGQIGLLSFGGPAAQIGLMHRELVDRRAWLNEADYLRALSFCMLLPGPEAMQLATYAGWRLRGVRGGLLAGLLFVLPGAALILTLAAAYVRWGQLPLVAALFIGVKAAVVVIVIEALLRVARRALKGRIQWAIAGLALAGIFLLNLAFPLLILVAALAGAMLLAPATATPPQPATSRSGAGHLLPTLAFGGALWAAPLALAWGMDQRFLLQVGLFFSKLALVTFGGAYAVLAYMTQAVVQSFGWLDTAQMMDALGLAETTPGPLILVTTFVAFLAGHGQAGWGTALLAGLMSLWVTFVPCFLWIFAFAPYIEAIAHRPRLQGALSGISAAVVGVIASLGLWFALRVLFANVSEWTFGPLALPIPSGANIASMVIMAVAAWLLLVRHTNLFAVLGLSAGLGLLSTLVA